MARTRQCSKCGSKRLLKFYKTPRSRVCTKCQRGRVSVASRAVRLKETYDITEDEYKALLEAQGGACAICGGRRAYNLDVDHDHALEDVVGVRASIRGLLCKQCNRRILRAVRDRIDILEAAIRYLKDPPARHVLQVLTGATHLSAQ